MSQLQGHVLQYAQVFKGMERKALRVQTLSLVNNGKSALQEVLFQMK